MTAPDTPPPLSRIAPARLFALLLLFVAACGYAVFHSERFQRETRELAIRSASAAIGREVSFRSLSFAALPPSVTIRDLRIAGGPGETLPFFEAPEVSLGGRVSFIGRTLSLGSVSLARPRLHVTVFPDGSDNLPPGLAGGPTGGIKVRVGSVAIVGGTLLFNETRVPLDLRLHGFVSELVSAGGRNIFRGRLGCRVATAALGADVKIPFDLDARFDLGEGRLHVDSLRVSGAFGTLHAIGEIPNLSNPRVTAWIEGKFDAGAVEDLFRMKLPFRGAGTIAAVLHAGKDQPLSVSGRAEFPRLIAENFSFNDVSALITAGADGLTARIERMGFDGGAVEGVLSISRFDRAPQQFDLVVDGRRVGIERFFGDLGLPGTRLAGAADLSLALRWKGGDIEKGDGGAELSIAPAGEGVPLSGGGPIAIRGGFLDFEGVSLKVPQSTIALDGGFALGDWRPRFRFAIASGDFRSLDAVATNFARAISGKPAEPFGLAGSGKIDGTLAGTWGAPEVSARLSAENAEYSGLKMGTVFADLSVADRAFEFHPLRAYDGDSRLSLSGTLRYAPKKGARDFDIVAETSRFPVERLLKFLAIDLPVTGQVTGTLPVAGSREALTGEGDLTLEKAVLYGQPVDRLTGRLALSPGRAAISGLRGQIGDSLFGGEGAFGFAGRTFSFRVSADNLPFSRIAAVPASEDLAGEVSFHASGSGSIDHPRLAATLSTRRLRVFGRAVPDALAPAATVTIEGGRLAVDAGAKGRWSVTARGSVEEGSARRIEVAVSVADVPAFSAVVPGFPSGLSGEIEGAGFVALAPDRWEIRDSRFTLSRLRLASGSSEIREASPITLAYAGGKLTTAGARLEGAGTKVDVSGSIDLAHDNALSGTLGGEVEAGDFERLLGAEAALTGTVRARLTVAGTLSRPLFTGRVSLSGGRYRSLSSPYVLDAVTAEMVWNGARASLEAFRARIGGGELVATGDAEIDGYQLKTFRLLAQAQNVTFRSFEDLNLQANADLTVVGSTDRATVRGEVTLLSGVYTKDFAPTLASLFGRTRGAEYASGRASWEDAVVLDVHVVSSASLEVRNNLARLTASVDLLARGTLAEPVLLGQIAIDEGGKITLQDVKYEIVSGTITFGNPARTEPVIDVSATAEVKGYAINAQAVGTLGGRSRVQFNLSSDPPLTNEQIASLLLTGSTPETGRSAEGTSASSVVGSIAGLAFRPVTSRVQQLFRLDRFQVDPVLQSAPGSSGGAVITIGKNLSKDLSVTYSYSAETNAQSIVLVEYQINANKVIQASKDENNVYSIGIKFRKRF